MQINLNYRQNEFIQFSFNSLYDKFDFMRFNTHYHFGTFKLPMTYSLKRVVFAASTKYLYQFRD